MCGIVGYVGKRRVVPILLEGLKRLEYRGYDSAGIVYAEAGGLRRYRAEGKLSRLEARLEEALAAPSYLGLGHTRWATHGLPTEANAHPHTDCTGNLVVVHNGIIENYRTLKEDLLSRGHTFASETDTEVLAHLIEEHLEDDLLQAVVRAIALVEGSYAIGVLCGRFPDMLVAARNQSPLVLGIQDEGGAFLASDVPAILPYTNRVVFLDDGECAVLTGQGIKTYRSDKGTFTLIDKPVTTIQWTAGMAEKAGYKHFMLKEIFEQPQAVTSTIRGRIDPESCETTLPELDLDREALSSVDRIFLVACGTSWHAAMTAKYWFEKYARIPTEVDIASEFRYRSLIMDERVLVVTISQSGETADTLAGLRRAKELGARVVTICNVVGSTMTREADGTVYTHAGPEIGVASTKAFTSQLAALMLMTIHFAAMKKSVPHDSLCLLARALVDLPRIMDQELPRLKEEIEQIAADYLRCQHFLFIGRGRNFPIALEGALKLKEISYIHAEGYAAGELKHGPIALIDRNMPVMAIVPRDEQYRKTVSNIEEIKARGGRLLLIGSSDDQRLRELGDHVLTLPRVHEDLNPILFTLPAQLLAYEIAARLGCDVDQPRNLAKSVTVE